MSDDHPELSFEIVYSDEHLWQIEAVIDTGDWRGHAHAYTVPQDISAFASDLRKFTDGTTRETTFAAGEDNGIGLIALRFYRPDRARHIAGYLRLSAGRLPTNPRPEQISRLSIEFGVELWALTRFAAELGQLSEAQAARVSLHISAEV